MSFPTANRGEARRAYINALRAADGLPPLPERPETTWRPAESVAVALTSARPPVLVTAPEAAPGAVVSFFYVLSVILTYMWCTVVYVIAVYLHTYFYVLYCGVLTYLFLCTVLRCTYVLIFMYCKNVMCGNNIFIAAHTLPLPIIFLKKM